MAERHELADFGGCRLNAPRSASVEIQGRRCRIWQLGEGNPLVFIHGMGGLPRWSECLDRLAGNHRVIAPSLPGFPGTGAIGDLDSQLDWLLATKDLILRAGVARCNLVGISLGAALAADVAALWPELVQRLVLVSPLGLFDEREPTADVFAQRADELASLLCSDPARYETHVAQGEDEDFVEWTVAKTRAHEAAARLLWPVGDTGLVNRLERITCPTLLVFGSADRVVPASYRSRFIDGIAGETKLEIIEGAGHMADIDAPLAVSQSIDAFLS